jgi:hypothetical protein
MFKKRSIAIVAGSVLLPVALLSQIPGLPTIVLDPTQSIHAGTQIANEIREIEQAIQTYRMITNEYNQIVYNATWMRSKYYWLGIATQVVNSTSRSNFGETAAWNPAVTANQGVPGAWGAATAAVHPPGFWAAYPVGGSTMSANLATLNIADGTSQAAMSTIGNSRANAVLNDQALAGLESASQDTGDGTNSEVGQLNLISGATVLTGRQMQNQNALLTTMAEQQLLTNKTQRDRLADSINTMATRDNALANEGTAWGGSAATIAGY